MGTLVWVGALALVPSPAFADDDAAWMYSPREVADVVLQLDPAAIASIEAEPKEWVAATFAMTGSGGEAFGPVNAEFKLKGNASFRPLAGKAAFKLKFKSGGRPWGLKRMTLNNMVQDPSKVRETMAYEVFRAIGVPAPRTGYAEVEINGSGYGLYLNLEVMTEDALGRWFPSTQHLYEGEDVDLLPGSALEFEVDEGDQDDRSDLAALIAAANDPAPSWFTDLAAVADVDEMVRMWAGEVFLQHWDGYVANANNYYLHSDGGGVFSWLPSGTDQALADGRTEYFLIDDSIHLNERGPLVRRCLLDEACRALYAGALQQARAAAIALDVPHGSMDLFDFLRPHIAADPRLEHSVDDARISAARIGDVVRSQSQRLDEDLVASPSSPTGLTVEPADRALVVSWEEARTHGAAPVSGYAVRYRERGRSGLTELVLDGATQRSARLAPLRRGASYRVSVRALSDSGPGAAVTTEASTLAPDLSRPRVRLRAATLKPGRRAPFAVRVRNHGHATVAWVRVCVRAPRKLLRIRRCVRLGELRPGEATTARFVARVRRRAVRGSRIELRIMATGARVSTERSRSVVEVG